MKNSPHNSLEEDIRNRLERIILEAISEKQFRAAPSHQRKTVKVLNEKLQLRLFASELISRWIEGESPSQIAQGMGQPIKLIYPLLKKIGEEITRNDRIK